MFFSRQTQSGVSLIELIVYVALLSVIAIVVVGSMLPLARSYRNLQVTRDLTHSATVAFEHMTREIQRAESINTATSTFDVHPGQLVITVGTTTTAYQINSDNRLVVSQNGVSHGPLTKENVSVDSLVFRRGTSAVSDVVKIEMELSATRHEVAKSAVFTASAVLRGMYGN